METSARTTKTAVCRKINNNKQNKQQKYAWQKNVSLQDV